MTDIIQRLRCTVPCADMTAKAGCHCAEARDEIIRLRAMVTPKPLDGTIVDLAKENRMLKSPQWQPMSTAPKDETPVLAYYDALDTIYEVIWHPERGEWVCYDYEIDNFCQSDFTAWMPSPKHPVNPDRVRRDWEAPAHE